MIRLAIVVEGETEEAFVNGALVAHLSDHGVSPTPIKPARRGGNVSVERMTAQMAKLQASFDSVTSLVDFYGFRGKRPGETVEHLESRIDEELDKRLRNDRDPSRVFAYVQRHEFEGLLFAEVNAFRILPDATPESLQVLRDIRAEFPTPEDINDSSETVPSKRIQRVVPRYRKTADGPLLAEKTGLQKIRAECPRFDGWVTRLESLGRTGRAAPADG